MNRNTIAGVVVFAVLIAFGIGFAVSKSNDSTDKPANTNNNSSNNVTPSSSGKSVDLSGQQLTAIPASVLSQTDIVSLNLSNNQLTTLPADIGKLTNLETLNVENNRLESLPDEIGLMSKLKNADFSNNRLASLPAGLNKLQGLQVLNLNSYKGPQSDLDHLKQQLPYTEIKT
jgi:Leucine-rich repeat (LRR) protein